MEGHVFVVPLGLFPVFRAIVAGELHNASAELLGLQQQELNDEARDMGIVSFQRM